MPSKNMSTKQSTSGNQIDIDEEFDDDIEAEIDYEEIRRRRERNDLVSKKLGELLLKGYKMLDETCEKCSCILMQLRNEPKLCVNCNDLSNQNQTISTSLQQPTPTITTNVPQQTASAIVEEKLEEKKIYAKENKEAISNKLSEYLLKGYKMLNSICAKCDCILMQKRNDKPFCVFCEEIDKPKEENKIESKIISSPELLPLTSLINQFDRNDTIKTLQQKIQWANNELKITNQTNIKFTIELCDLIKSATNAIIALEQLKK